MAVGLLGHRGRTKVASHAPPDSVFRPARTAPDPCVRTKFRHAMGS